MPDSNASTCYEFGGYLLDTHRCRVIQLSPRQPIPLPPRVFDTLAYLVEHAGELIDKAVLLNAIWPDSVAEENSLNQNISLLRRALGERPTEHRFIITVPGRGYRFVARVRNVVRPEEASAPAASVAVLPFANLTGNAANDYLGDGLAEELIHRLSKLPGLSVAARTSSFAYRRNPTDVRQVARELGVRTILEGAVRSVGQRIRVTLQLIEGETGYHICSRSIERQAEQLFNLEDELVGEVAEALGISARVPARATRDVEAHHQYMQARGLSTLPTPDNLRGALEFLKQAAVRDPQFARAWSLMAAVYGTCIEYDYPIADAMVLAERAARRAIDLDPTDGASLAAVGVVQALRGHWVDAEAQFRNAVARPTDPFLNNLHCVYVTQAVGHLRRALDEALEAHRFAAAQQFGTTMIALAHVLLGQNEEALAWVDRSAALGESITMTPQADMRAQLALRAGRHADAAAVLIASTPPRLVQAGASQAIHLMCSALEGMAPRAQAVAALRTLEARLRPEELDQILRKRLLVWYTMLEELDATCELLEGSLDYYARKGFVGSAWGVLWLPELRPLRRDPRFQAFASRLRLFEYWDMYGPPDGHELRAGVLVCP